jgi:hypothetical protein
MTKSKGTWTITDAGGKALAAFPDPEKLMLEAVRLYCSWKLAQPDDDPIPEPDDEDSSASASATLEEAVEDAWQETQTYLETINPYDFQDLFAAPLRAMGYHVAWVSPPGPDRGLDILAYTDPLGAYGSERLGLAIPVIRRAPGSPLCAQASLTCRTSAVRYRTFSACNASWASSGIHRP